MMLVHFDNANTSDFCIPVFTGTNGHDTPAICYVSDRRKLHT